MKTPFLLLALGLGLSPVGYAQSPKVSVIAVESITDFREWLGTPVNAARAASVSTYPGRVTRLTLGTKSQLPILLTGLPSPAPEEMIVVADVEIRGTDGRPMGTSAKCCMAHIKKGSKESAVIMTSTVGIEPEAGRQGRYTVHVSVTDGERTWTASEVLPYGASPDMPGSANEAPRLRMNVPPAQLEGGGPGDKRDCLALPTPAEVIKCSEKKK